MRINTAYNLWNEVITGTTIVSSPQTRYTTGKPTIAVPALSVLIPANAQSSQDEGILLHTYVPGSLAQTTFPVAVDVLGNVVWYYPNTAGWGYVTRSLAGGTMLFIQTGPGSVYPSQRYQLLKEIDLAGNTIRMTNASRIAEQIPRAPNNSSGRSTMRLFGSPTGTPWPLLR